MKKTVIMEIPYKRLKTAEDASRAMLEILEHVLTTLDIKFRMAVQDKPFGDVRRYEVEVETKEWSAEDCLPFLSQNSDIKNPENINLILRETALGRREFSDLPKEWHFAENVFRDESIKATIDFLLMEGDIQISLLDTALLYNTAAECRLLYSYAKPEYERSMSGGQ